MPKVIPHPEIVLRQCIPLFSSLSIPRDGFCIVLLHSPPPWLSDSYHTPQPTQNQKRGVPPPAVKAKPYGRITPYPHLSALRLCKTGDSPRGYPALTASPRSLARA